MGGPGGAAVGGNEFITGASGLVLRPLDLLLIGGNSSLRVGAPISAAKFREPWGWWPAFFESRRQYIQKLPAA